MPRVLNKKTATKQQLTGAVYIGRPGPWGNPFKIGRDGSRMDVVEKYANMLLNDPELIAQARRELKGKNLVCWCKPDYCHGDVLLDVANGT